MSSTVVVLISLIAVAGGMVAVQQVSATEQLPTFRSTVELVVVHVNVVDQQRRPIVGLSKQDFLVLENGVPQQVSHFLSSDVPIDVALLLDASSSMAPILSQLHASALEFFNGLRPGDRGMLVGFNDRTRILAGLTADEGELRRAVSRLHAGGDTSLYDAMYITLKTLSSASTDLTRRQALVVLSDGNDTSSILGIEEVQRQSIQCGVPIYTILLTEEKHTDMVRAGAYEDSMRRFEVIALARDSGGQVFRIEDGPNLEQAYASIAQQLSQQYVLAYVAPGGDRSGTEPRIVVQIPSRPNAVAGTHVGYVNRTPLGG